MCIYKIYGLRFQYLFISFSLLGLYSSTYAKKNTSIQKSSCPKIKTGDVVDLGEDTFLEDGIRVAFTGAPIYSKCDSVEPKGKNKFLKHYYIIAKSDEFKRYCVGQINNYNNKVKKRLGWVNYSDVFNSEPQTTKKNSSIYKKALIVMKMKDTFDKVKDDKKNKDAYSKILTFNHYKGGKTYKNINVFNIYYVYTPSNLNIAGHKRHLLSKSILSSLGDSDAKDKIVGWVDTDHLLFWSHREAVEVNKKKEAMKERESFTQ
jgi:hypothetical protein